VVQASISGVGRERRERPFSSFRSSEDPVKELVMADSGRREACDSSAAQSRRRLGEERAEREQDLQQVARIRAGDERAFLALVERHHRAMVRLAGAYVPPGVAEEVAQEAWIGVLKGLDRFEGRSSLKAWIFRILLNCAKFGGSREARAVPFSALETESSKSSVFEERFLNADHPRWPGHWVRYPEPWSDERLISEDTLQLVGKAMDGLPNTQREVMRLRDLEGWSSSEVCEALDISEGNQRVLLHRARSTVRHAIEPYLSGGEKP
jgi:RNA polymerase sigma-70 factor (ECF subfamily)